MSDTEALREQLRETILQSRYERFWVDADIDTRDAPTEAIVSAVLPVVESWASTAGNEQGLRAKIEALADELDRTAWRASHEPAYSRLASETSAKLRALLETT